jgi:hypothetical protein
MSPLIYNEDKGIHETLRCGVFFFPLNKAAAGLVVGTYT